MAIPVLEVNNLTKRFGKVTAVNGINMTLNQGEVFGYIGPNGAGKTTTINVLLGILRASSGSVQIFGKDAWSDAVEIHKRISFVPGDVNLWPNLTGGEVIDLFTSLRGKVDVAKRKRLLEMFELDPTKKCRTYSKGNRQKVALVSAFAADSDLYILDEPTSGLDPLMEQVFQECVSEQKNNGKTILLSSHILSEVERLCDRVSIIREGKIIETGTLSELRHLTNITMTVDTIKHIENLEQIKGISGIKRQNNGLSFQVESSEIGNVVAEISRYGVTKLESMPPTLEDLFMRHYGGVQNEK
ncbi:MAG: ATP-binding cassette domain-containing protein [Clostridium sp.]